MLLFRQLVVQSLHFLNIKPKMAVGYATLHRQSQKMLTSDSEVNILFVFIYTAYYIMPTE